MFFICAGKPESGAMSMQHRCRGLFLCFLAIELQKNFRQESSAPFASVSKVRTSTPAEQLQLMETTPPDIIIQKLALINKRGLVRNL